MRLKLVNKKLKPVPSIFICIILLHEQTEIHRPDSVDGSIHSGDYMGTGYLDHQFSKGTKRTV
jgi:hypothetical protein